MEQQRFVQTGNNSFYGEYLYDQVVPQDHFLRKLPQMIDDASHGYESGTNQNYLRDEDIDRIVKTYLDFPPIEKYASLASLAGIRVADYNLNIPRYMDTFEEEEEVDNPVVQKEIEEIEAALVQVQADLKK